MAQITVFAGTNGAGKSSVIGAHFRTKGGQYFNPDEVAKELREQIPGTGSDEANGQAWEHGRRMLEQAISDRVDYAFETTLGGNTIKELLANAIDVGLEVLIFYVGLISPELHLARVRARVAKGGHDIPEENIRRRYDASRLNLIDLMNHGTGLHELAVFDNSAPADPATGVMPRPLLLLRMRKQKVVALCDIGTAPEWVKPILMTAIQLDRAAAKRAARRN